MKKTNRNMLKKLTGVLLCAALIMSAMPAFAAPEEQTAVETAKGVSEAAEEAADAKVSEKAEAAAEEKVEENKTEAAAEEKKEEAALTEEKAAEPEKEAAEATPSEAKEEEKAELPAEKEEEYTVSTIVFTEDGKLILPRPVKDGKAFIEWNTKEDGSGTGYKAGTVIDPADIVLYSIWEDEAENTENEVKAEVKEAAETEEAGELADAEIENNVNGDGSF